MRVFSYWNTLRMSARNFHSGENEGEAKLIKNHWWTKGIEIAVLPTTRCGLHCNYCPMYYAPEEKEELWDGKYPRYEECTLEEWKEWFEKLPFWVSQVYITGGEPTKIDWIGDLVNWLVRKNHHVIMFSYLENPEVLYNIEMPRFKYFPFLKKSFLFVYYPTFHQHLVKEEDYNFKNPFGDDYNRFKSALEKLRANTDFRIIIKELEEDKKFGSIKTILNYAKKLYTDKWFFQENALYHAPPNAPKTGILYWGCVKTYLGGK